MTTKRKHKQIRLTGLTAAVYTPMRANGDLNLDQANLIVDSLLRDGVSNIFVCGSTGEGLSLTSEERKQTAAAYVEAVNGRIPVIVHVGHNSLREVQKLAEHAEEIGAVAIAAAPPSYFKPSGINNLIDCCAEISAGAPSLPFYYYHIPCLTGVNFSMLDFLRAAETRLPSLAGVKFTDEDIMAFQMASEFNGGAYDFLFGRDQILLAALAVGAKGAIGSTYNYAAPLYRRLWDAFNRGNLEEARMCQSRAQTMVDLQKQYDILPSGKAIMKLIGLDIGPCRLPLRSLSSSEITSLEKRLKEIGFFDWRH